MDPNSRNQRWSEWVFVVTTMALARTYQDVLTNVSRFAGKAFGSTGRASLKQEREGWTETWTLTVHVEGLDANDARLVDYFRTNFTAFFINGFGVSTKVTCQARVLAGERVQGEPADQWIELPFLGPMRSDNSMKTVQTVLLTLLLMLVGVSAHAQTQTPPPAQPIAFCGNQASPAATSHQLVFDGGAAETVTVVTSASTGPVVTFCNQNAPSGWTHGFQVAANRFPPRAQPYTVSLTSVNEFGQTVGTVWEVRVGIAPGQFTITAAGQLPGE